MNHILAVVDEADCDGRGPGDHVLVSLQTLQ
jgi:hypothetical protein